MRNRRTFCQRMGRSKTNLVDLCSPSTPLFVMLILEEVGSVVDYPTSQRFRPIFAFEERKWLLNVMVWKRVLGWDRYDSKAKAVATRAELRLEVVTRIWLHWIRLMARTFSLLGLELLADYVDHHSPHNLSTYLFLDYLLVLLATNRSDLTSPSSRVLARASLYCGH